MKGYTLVETLVVATLLAVMLGMAMPSMRHMVLENRLSAHVNELIAANLLARSEAIACGCLVTICRSVNAEFGSNACSSQASGDRDASDWAVGWLVFMENGTASAGLGVVDAGEKILLRQAALSSKTHSVASAKKISYNSTGEPIGSVTGAHFIFNVDGAMNRIVCITRTGRIRVILDAVKCS